MSGYIYGEYRFGNSAQLRCHDITNHALCSCTCNKKVMVEESLDNHKKKMQKKLNPSNVQDVADRL
jgi:hypothetical protein